MLYPKNYKILKSLFLGQALFRDTVLVNKTLSSMPSLFGEKLIFEDIEKTLIFFSISINNGLLYVEHLEKPPKITDKLYYKMTK